MSYFFPRVLLFMVFFYIFESGSARGGDAITQRADRQFGTRQLRHSFRIDQVVFSPDRRLLASRDQRGNIKVWNTSTWNEVTDLNLASTTSDICFSPDGAYLVSTSALGVQRLNLKDASITTLSPGFPREHPRLAMYSPDSRLFAFADANKIEVFDFTLKRMKAHLDGHTGEFHSMSFFRDGSKLVSGGEDRTVRVWDLATGKLLHRLNSGEERVNKVAVDCFCKYIVSGGNDGVLRIWSASDGKELKQFKFANDISILALDFSRDGKLLAVGDSDGTVYLIDVEHFEVKNKLKGNPIAVTCLAFGGDRAFLAVAGDDNAIRMFNLDWTPEFPPVGHTDFVYSLDFSPDQKTFVSGGRDKLLCVWDCATEKEILRAKTPEEVGLLRHRRDWSSVMVSHGE